MRRKRSKKVCISNNREDRDEFVKDQFERKADKIRMPQDRISLVRKLLAILLNDVYVELFGKVKLRFTTGKQKWQNKDNRAFTGFSRTKGREAFYVRFDFRKQWSRHEVSIKLIEKEIKYFSSIFFL